MHSYPQKTPEAKPPPARAIAFSPAICDTTYIGASRVRHMEALMSKEDPTLSELAAAIEVIYAAMHAMHGSSGKAVVAEFVLEPDGERSHEFATSTPRAEIEAQSEEFDEDPTALPGGTRPPRRDN